MQLPSHSSLVFLIAAGIVAICIILLAPYSQTPVPLSTNLSGVPVQIASTSSKTFVNPGSFERYCLPEGEDQSQFLTSFWGMITNKTGVDDSSAVILNFDLTGYPDKIPLRLWFSFSSKKDWWSGSRMVFYIGDDEGTCVCFSITPLRERPDISGERVPSPGKLFAELEQVPFSDIGVGGKELFITTGLRYGATANSSAKRFLLANGSVIPLQEISFNPNISLVYPWVVQIMECREEPKGCSSSEPVARIISVTRLPGANVSVRK